MKIFFILLLGLVSLNANSENTTYSSSTRIATIPIVCIDGKPALTNVKLKLRNDGLLELSSFDKYLGDPARVSCEEIPIVNAY